MYELIDKLSIVRPCRPRHCRKKQMTLGCTPTAQTKMARVPPGHPVKGTAPIGGTLQA